MTAWYQQSAHDTAKECQQAKVEYATQLIDLMKKDGKDTTPTKEPLIQQAMGARCFPPNGHRPRCTSDRCSTSSMPTCARA